MARLENHSTPSISDEWVITHLASDKVTGLCHEIDILESLGIIEVGASGNVFLAPGWQRRAPHVLLNEMRDEWGSEKDVHNLYCIHSTIRSIENHWECIEEQGWRRTSDGEETFDLDFDEDEYDMRRQIFTENFQNYVNVGTGVGDFGC